MQLGNAEGGGGDLLERVVRLSFAEPVRQIEGHDETFGQLRSLISTVVALHRNDDEHDGSGDEESDGSQQSDQRLEQQGEEAPPARRLGGAGLFGGRTGGSPGHGRVGPFMAE